MITREDCFTASEFHADGGCKVVVGPRGGVSVKIEIWRRNGQTKVWITRPNDAVVPVKHGLRDYGYVRFPSEAHYWHTRDNCPVIRDFQSEEK